MLGLGFKNKAVDKSVESTETTQNLGKLKKLDDLKNGLQKLAKLCKTLEEKGDLHFKSTSALGESLSQFQVLPSSDEKNSFSLSMAKFSAIWSDIAELEKCYCDECSVFVTAVNDFVNEITETTKRVKKSYEFAKGEYDKAFAKVVAVKESKKFLVSKLYQAEKERAVAYAAYLKEVTAMEIHLTDLEERVNYVFTDYLIKWFSAQRAVITKSYEELDHSKQYLIQLQNWCLEEERVFEEQRAERENTRKKVHAEFAEVTKKRFIEYFQNIDLCLACLDSNQDPQGNIICANLPAAIAHILTSYNFPLPQPVAQLLTGTTQPIKGLETTQAYCKENIDSIGTKLLERNLSDLFVNFGESLANLERVIV